MYKYRLEQKLTIKDNTRLLIKSAVSSKIYKRIECLTSPCFFARDHEEVYERLLKYRF